jgi:hypothetical protein
MKYSSALKEELKRSNVTIHNVWLSPGVDKCKILRDNINEQRKVEGLVRPFPNREADGSLQRFLRELSDWHLTMTIFLTFNELSRTSIREDRIRCFR